MKEESMPPEETQLHNKPPRNDGPDQTPVWEDLYHDEGRSNPLDEDVDEAMP